MNAFMKSIDTTVLGRKTYEVSLSLGATFGSGGRTIVFSRHAPPADAPAGVEFVNEAIGPFVSRLRKQPGKDIWLMGGGDIIASFLDEQAIDEFVISVVPVFIGDGHPADSAAPPSRAPGSALGRTLRRWARPAALPRAEEVSERESYVVYNVITNRTNRYPRTMAATATVSAPTLITRPAPVAP